MCEKNSLVTSKDHTILIEALRQLCELILWGDQRNDPQFFEYMTLFKNTIKGLLIKRN